MLYTVTRTVTLTERWHNIEASSQYKAEALVASGLVKRQPDHEDASDELIEAEEEDSGLGTFTLVGEFTLREKVRIARVFSTMVPAAEHAEWTVTRHEAILSAVEHGGILTLFATSVRGLCRSLENLYLGHVTDENGNNRCTSWERS